MLSCIRPSLPIEDEKDEHVMTSQEGNEDANEDACSGDPKGPLSGPSSSCSSSQLKEQQQQRTACDTQQLAHARTACDTQQLARARLGSDMQAFCMVLVKIRPQLDCTCAPLADWQMSNLQVVYRAIHRLTSSLVLHQDTHLAPFAPQLPGLKPALEVRFSFLETFHGTP
jgi:hypothetical protein